MLNLSAQNAQKNAKATPHDKLGDALLQAQVVTEEQLQQATQLQAKKGGSLAEIILAQGFADEEIITEHMAKIWGLEYILLFETTFDKKAKTYLPEAVAKRHNVLPIRVDDALFVASAQPISPQNLRTLERLAKKSLKVAIASKSTVTELLSRLYEIDAVVDFEDKSAVEIVDGLLLKALRCGASDIHIEALEHSIKVRFRVDGILQEISSFPTDMLAVLTSRIKVMAGLNIAEKRSPQDGAFVYEAPEDTIDLRVSSLPCIHGEKIVMRILAGKSNRLTVEQVGLSDRDMDCFNRLIRRPHGIILIVGPTGSGKSTTLCAALNSINSIDINITTVEDPVEYKIDGINQVQVSKGDKVTFAAALRSILRQDPDVVMVGETRDMETASISLRASLTGHLVFTTLHTNDAAGALPRLVDMGCEPFLVGASVSGVLAQRLLRRLCPKCKEAYEPTPEQCAELGIDAENVITPWYKPRGCPACLNSGYKGRIGVFELLEVNEAVRTEILKGSNARTIAEVGKEAGMTTLREDGIRKLQMGTTSMDEVLRTTIKG